MSVRRDFDEVGSDGIVDELVVFGNEFVEAFLDHLLERQRGLCFRTVMRRARAEERRSGGAHLHGSR